MKYKCNLQEVTL